MCMYTHITTNNWFERGDVLLALLSYLGRRSDYSAISRRLLKLDMVTATHFEMTSLYICMYDMACSYETNGTVQ